MLDTFQDLGRDLYLTGLVSSHTGTLSVRIGDRAVISRRDARLGRLTAEDLIEFAIDGECPEQAADDAIVHQTVYRSTDAGAVIYAHPTSTMALALIEDRLSTANAEGAEVRGSAPVLITQRPIESPDVAHLVSRMLRESRIVAMRGHGVFARGRDLEDALHMVSLLEEMCKVARIYRTLVREEPQPSRDWRERPAVSPYRARGDVTGARRSGPRPTPPRGPVSGPNRRTDGPARRPMGESNGPGGHRGQHRR